MQPEVWTKIGKAAQRKEKKEWKTTRSPNSTILDDWAESTLLIRRTRMQGNLENAVFRAHIPETWGFCVSTALYYSLSEGPKLRHLFEDEKKSASWRKRAGTVVPKAENVGDLITADHTSEGCESRNNHRYAVVVQDLATQWIQSYPCKTTTSQETQRSLQKFLEPDRKPKVIYIDNSLEFGRGCEDLSWNHCTSTPHRSETDGIPERAVRRVKRRHLCCIVAFRSGWKMVGRFHGMLYLSAKHSRSLVWWEDALWKTFWTTI